MRLANTAGGTLEARWSMAVLRLARVGMPSRSSGPTRDEGCWCWAAFLPGNSQRGSARVGAARKSSEENTSELQWLVCTADAAFGVVQKIVRSALHNTVTYT